MFLLRQNEKTNYSYYLFNILDNSLYQVTATDDQIKSIISELISAKFKGDNNIDNEQFLSMCKKTFNDIFNNK
jgi:hypothetical protein